MDMQAYLELDDCVKRYKEGDQEAAAELIERFNGFLTKFQNLICYGQFDFTDGVIRNFIGLFVQDKKVKKNLYRYQQPAIRLQLLKTAQRIQQLYEFYTPEDIYHELVVVLLSMAQRYESFDGKPRFHNFVAKAFHFYFINATKSKSIQYCTSLDGDVVDMREQIDIDSLDNRLGHSLIYNAEELMNQEIGDNWVLGLTCSEIFSDLTIFERKILKWYYIDGMTDQEIAFMTGFRRETINIRRNKLKGQIANELEKEKESY